MMYKMSKKMHKEIEIALTRAILKLEADYVTQNLPSVEYQNLIDVLRDSGAF